MEPSVWWVPSKLGPSNQLITNSLGRKERKDDEERKKPNYCQ